MEHFKASGQLRPYTPFAITLDKADEHRPQTMAEVRSANRVYSAEVQEAERVASEARAHKIMAEMRDLLSWLTIRAEAHCINESYCPGMMMTICLRGAIP